MAKEFKQGQEGQAQDGKVIPGNFFEELDSCLFNFVSTDRTEIGIGIANEVLLQEFIAEIPHFQFSFGAIIPDLPAVYAARQGGV